MYNVVHCTVLCCTVMHCSIMYRSVLQADSLAEEAGIAALAIHAPLDLEVLGADGEHRRDSGREVGQLLQGVAHHVR